MDILELIKNNKKFRAALIEHDENVVDVLYKFVESPECSSCVNDMNTYIKQNLESINTIINDITPNQPPEIRTPPSIPHLTLPPTPINVSGEVYEIEADPQQYKQLIAHAQQQRWIFRGVNVMEKTSEEGKKNWVLFFY